MVRTIKRILSAVLLTLMVCCLAIFAGSCGEKLASPENLKLSSSGELKWTAGADMKYEVSVDGSTYVEVEKNSADLLELVKSTEVNKIYVRAKQGKKTSEASVFEIVVVQLATPEKPEIAANPETNESQFVWSKVDKGNKYYYSVNGGKWVSTSNTYFTPVATGSFKISVKARGYASKNTLYLESAASPESDLLEFITGPVLSNDAINEISWESIVEFDSYNLWVDGVKVRENVTSPMNLVTGEDPVLTKTGEYDIQIEAIKGNVTAWSNIYTQFGTSNINENEIYSFDNRVWNLTTYYEGVSLSDEQYHGDSGYSLKVRQLPQFNLVRYASDDINVVDFSDVLQVWFWVYIEPIEGYEYDYVPAELLPTIKNGGNTTNYFATESAPIGEWTKVTIDCENYYEIVMIFAFHYSWAPFWPDGVARPFTMYIDDISYEVVEEAVVADYDYKLSYRQATLQTGAWYGSALTQVNFGSSYFGKTVLVDMQICGEVGEGLTAPIGLVVFADAAGTQFVEYITIDTDKIASSEWQTVSVALRLNKQGEVYIAAARTDSAGTLRAFKMYIKDIEVTFATDYILKFDSAEEYSEMPYTLDLGDEYAYKTVEFEMEVCGTLANAIGAEGLGLADLSKTYELIIPRASLASTETWTKVKGLWTLNEKGQLVAYTMFKSEEAEKVYEMYIRNFTVVSADDANVLLMTSNYGNYKYGTFGGVERIDEKGVSILANAGEQASGFVLKTAAVQKMVDMGMKEITFTLGVSAYNSNPVAGYVYLYTSVANTSYIVNISDAAAKKANGAYFAAGSTITINLYDFLVAIGTGDGLNFCLTNQAAWGTDASPAYVTLTNFAYTYASALEIMFNASSYVSQPFHGKFSGVEKVGENGAKILAEQVAGNPGFILTKAAIRNMVNRGATQVSFTVNFEVYGTGALPGYLCIYAGSTRDYLVNLSESVILLNENAIFVSAGQTITIDLVKLLEVIGDTTGLEFNIFKDAVWTPSSQATSPAYVTFTNIIFS